jgi:hypothetical protein
MTQQLSYMRMTDDGTFEVYNGSDWLPINVQNKPTEVTYAELKKMADSGKLEPYRSYLITDFQTIHAIYEGVSDGYDLIEGPIEPIIVQAATNSTLFREAYSPEFPEDILYYELEPARVHGRLGPDEAKGVIYRRIDNKRNIDVPQDFRAVRNRRWRIGANDLGLPEDAYVLTSTEVKIGWDETVKTDSISHGNYEEEGRLTLTAPDPDDYKDLLMFNDRRELNPFGPETEGQPLEYNFDYKEIYIYPNWNMDLDYAGAALHLNTVFLPQGDLTSGFVEFFSHIYLYGTDNSKGIRHNTIACNSINSFEVRRAFRNNILFGGISGNFYEMIGNVYNASFPGMDSVQHYPTFNYNTILSGLKIDNSFWPTPAEPLGNEWSGTFIKNVWKHTDSDGNVADSGGNQLFYGCRLRHLKGFHVTKGGNAQFRRCDLTNMPNANRQGSTEIDNENMDFVYDKADNQKFVFLDRISRKSNFPETFQVSSGTVQNDVPQSRVIGEYHIDTSSGNVTISGFNNEAHIQPITVKATGGNSVSFDSSSVNLPSSTGGSLSLADNGLDYAEIKFINGTPTVVNYQTY